MIIPRFVLLHARTVAPCASASVKSHLSFNQATPRSGRVVSTLFIYRFSHRVLGWSVPSGFSATIFLSMARHPTRNGFRRLGFLRHPIEKPFGNTERLRHVFARFHHFSRYESKGGNLPLRRVVQFCTINCRQASWSTHFNCSCAFRGTGSRPIHWESCSRPHP